MVSQRHHLWNYAACQWEGVFWSEKKITKELIRTVCWKKQGRPLFPRRGLVMEVVGTDWNWKSQKAWTSVLMLPFGAFHFQLVCVTLDKPVYVFL